MKAPTNYVLVLLIVFSALAGACNEKKATAEPTADSAAMTSPAPRPAAKVPGGRFVREDGGGEVTITSFDASLLLFTATTRRGTVCRSQIKDTARYQPGESVWVYQRGDTPCTLVFSFTPEGVEIAEPNPANCEGGKECTYSGRYTSTTLPAGTGN